MALEKIAYTLNEASAATGYSRSEIERAIRRGELVARYANTKPVIPAKELASWIDSLPTQRPRTAG